MNRLKSSKLFLGVAIGVLLISILAFAPTAIRYFNGAVVVNGIRDENQLTVQGWTTQTTNLLVLEQSDGTDVFTVTNAGALGYSGSSTFSGTLAVSGAADFTFVQGIDAGAVGDSVEVAFTTPIDTAGTNTHNAFTADIEISNSTAGTNTVVALQIDTIVNDPQVNGKAINIGDEWNIALDTNSPVIATAQTWWDDFLGTTVLAMYTEISGSDAEAVQTIVEEQFGVYQLTSGDVGSNVAADGEGVYLSLEWQANQGTLIFETRLHLDTDIATVEICTGFTDDVTTVELPFTNASDTVTAVADDAVMFCFDTGSTTVEWFVNGAAGGTEATGIAAAGVAPTADVYQTLRIEVDDGGADCRFYIDGALVGTLTANCVTNTDLLAPGVIISSGGNAGSNVVDMDYMYASGPRD